MWSVELNKVLSMLAEYAGTEVVRQKALNFTPYDDERMIREALTETAEGVSVILYKGIMPVGSVDDIDELLTMARRGRILSMRDLISVRRSLKVARELKAFLSTDVPKLHQLEEIKSLIEILPNLEKEIERSIISETEISDTASSELNRIRREIRNKNETIRSKLAKYALSGSKYMQDDIVTVRNGRYVIPVKREYITQVPGMIHDQSQSGATVFIEPQAIVELNNQLKQLSMDEEAEIHMILANFTSEINRHYFEILDNQRLIEELDFINAKSRLAVSMDAVMPEINSEGRINIIQGRHPLIDKDEVVPVDVNIGTDFTTLLITGPNTGGKTVTLKTLGLFVLMAKCGLHVPCCVGSEIAIFKNIYADIGDEQSIEQSLSTFSSHMRRIVEILESADSSSLVLLDELGAGTDPAEGAALGISILEALKSKGATIAATTHYTELKKYAIESEGVENASMEFNLETLSPTYRVRIGLPGKSNAFEISKRLGIEDDIVNRAKKLMDANELSFENAVKTVEKNKALAEAELAETAKFKAEAEELVIKAEHRLENANNRKEEILDRARAEALEIIRNAKRDSEEIIKELKTSRKDKASNLINVTSESRRKLKELENKNTSKRIKKKSESGKMLNSNSAAVGMRVKAVNLGQNGVIEAISDDAKKATVRIGALKMDISLSELLSIENEEKGNKEKQKRLYNSAKKMYGIKSENISPEINVIGKNLDDAIAIVGKYLDDAFLAGLKKVTIIHGRGSGVLRTGIRDALKRNKNIKSFEPAPYNNGGEGATIVHIKE